MIKISIIGSASDPKFTKEDYEEMFSFVRLFLKRIQSKSNREIQIISGGAAWSDHLAVRAFLEGEVKRLSIYAPCPWNTDGKFQDTGSRDWRINPGYLSNLYHQRFSDKVNINSLKEIATAIEKGAEYKVFDGFHKRNDEVAKSDITIAFTFGGMEPEDGGTAYTWKKIDPSRRLHVSIPKLREYKYEKLLEILVS